MHPILFRLGSFEVGTYGLLLMAGFFAALMLAMRQGKTDEIPSEAVSDLAITVLMAGIIGSKLLMIIVDLISGVSVSQVFDLSTLRAGGHLHGGIILGTAAFFWRMHKWKLPLGKTLDALTPAVALGQAIGRLGCFAAGCCYGKACEASWGVTFTQLDAFRISGTPLEMRLHPVQIYTFLLELTIMGILLMVRKHRAFAGQVGAAFFMLEGVARMLLESWRGDVDRGLWFDLPWLSTGRLTGFAFLLFGFGLWLFFHRRQSQSRQKV